MKTLKTAATVLASMALLFVVLVGVMEVLRPDPFSSNPVRVIEYCTITPWDTMSDPVLERCIQAWRSERPTR